MPAEEDLAFERALLGAGRAEALPVERTASALLRFSAGVAVVQGTALLGSSPLTVSVGARAIAAGKWIALGVVTGSVITFAWMRHAASPLPARAPAVVAAPAASLPVAPAAISARPAADEPALAPPIPPGVRSSRAVRAPARAASSVASPSSSNLAAEVAALDGIRTALSIGAWRDAEQRVGRYRQEHPRGALRSEAEALAVEGLVAQGRKREARNAADRFIAEHPRDPQASRVRALVE